MDYHAFGNMKHIVTRVVIPLLLVICILFSLPLVCGHGHSHDHHGHSHDHHGHSHDHGDSHDLGNSHDDHEHLHDHGNIHDHHGHSHEHTHEALHPEEPPAYKWSKKANEPYHHEDSHHDSGREEKHADKERNCEESNTAEPTAPGHSEGHDLHGAASSSVKPPKSSIWLEAVSATLVISIAPYLILFFIPVTNSKEHEPYLKVLLAFASGGLLGDAFLHLIPHALMAQAAAGGEHHSHSHAHSHEAGGEAGHGHDMSIGLAVLGGIIAFLVVEKFVRIFKGSHSHSHSHAVPVTQENKAKTNGEKTDEKQINDDKKKKSKNVTKESEGK